MSIFLPKQPVIVDVVLPPIESLQHPKITMPQPVQKIIKKLSVNKPDIAQAMCDIFQLTEFPYGMYAKPSTPGQYGLRVDVIQYGLDQSHVYLLGKPRIGDEIAERYLKVFQSLLPDGITCMQHDRNTWFLQSDKPFAIETTPLFDVLGKDIRDYLPEGDDTWRKIQVEAQMAFFDSKNPKQTHGLWFWGNAKTPNFKQIDTYLTCYGESSVLLGLAAMENMPVANLASLHATELLPGHHLVMLDGLDSYMHTDCQVVMPIIFAKTYLSILQDLCDALYDGKIHQLNVRFLGEQPVVLKRNLFRFFRRRDVRRSPVAST